MATALTPRPLSTRGVLYSYSGYPFRA